VPDALLLRCARCGRYFREKENDQSACSHHSGRCLDFDKVGQWGPGMPGDWWDCCDEQVTDDDDPVGKGCTLGRHIAAAPDDPGPVEWAIREERRAFETPCFPQVAPFQGEDLDGALERITAAFDAAGFHTDRSANRQLTEDQRWWLRAFFVRWWVQERDRGVSHIFFISSKLRKPEQAPGFEKALNTLSYSEGHDGFWTEVHLLGAEPEAPPT